MQKFALVLIWATELCICAFFTFWFQTHICTFIGGQLALFRLKHLWRHGFYTNHIPVLIVRSLFYCYHSWNNDEFLHTNPVVSHILSQWHLCRRTVKNLIFIKQTVNFLNVINANLPQSILNLLKQNSILMIVRNFILSASVAIQLKLNYVLS